MIKALLIGIAAALLAGCAPTLQTDVTQFHAIKTPLWGKTFALLADPDQASSLEYQTDAGLVSVQLQAHGLIPEPAGQDVADFLVTVHLRVVDRRTELWAYEDPMFPSYYRWGPPPYVTFGTLVLSRMELDVGIWDGPAWRAGRQVMVFDGRSTAETEASDPNSIVKPLVDAMFQSFPAPSGVTRRIDLELP